MHSASLALVTTHNSSAASSGSTFWPASVTITLPKRKRYGPPFTLSGVQATQLMPDGHADNAAGADLQLLPAQHSRSQWLRNTNGIRDAGARALGCVSSPPALVTVGAAAGLSKLSAALAASAPNAAQAAYVT